MVLDRRGMTMLELLAAGALLAVLSTICLQMFAATAAQRRSADDRQTALREAANIMERLAAVPFERLTPEGVAAVELGPEARRALPGAELEIKVSSPPDQPDAKRIVLSLRWQDRNGQWVRPVCLTAWRWGGS